MRRSRYRPTIAVDLDGTLATYQGWQGVAKFGTPVPGARHFLQTLRQDGWRVVIYTCRVNLENGPLGRSRDLIVQWLRTHDLPYDEVWVERGKPIAFAYLDDRAISGRFESNPLDFAVALQQIRERATTEGVPLARPRTSSAPDTRAPATEPKGDDRSDRVPGAGDCPVRPPCG